MKVGMAVSCLFVHLVEDTVLTETSVQGGWKHTKGGKHQALCLHAVFKEFVMSRFRYQNRGV